MQSIYRHWNLIIEVHYVWINRCVISVYADKKKEREGGGEEERKRETVIYRSWLRSSTNEECNSCSICENNERERGGEGEAPFPDIRMVSIIDMLTYRRRTEQWKIIYI